MKDKYMEDLQEIRSIMDRSSKFISLSGLSGITAGISAILGALLAYNTVYQDQDYLNYRKAVLNVESILQLIIIAVGVLVISIGSGLYFTKRKAKQVNQQLWDDRSKRLLINLLIPLIAGGI